MSSFIRKCALQATTGRCFCRSSLTMGGRSFSSIFADQINMKEKVEEDRFIRQKEEALLEQIREKLAKEREAARAAELDQQFIQIVAPAMEEVSKKLKASGDDISKEGLETIAKWKLGLS